MNQTENFNILSRRRPISANKKIENAEKQTELELKERGQQNKIEKAQSERDQVRPKSLKISANKVSSNLETINHKITHWEGVNSGTTYNQGGINRLTVKRDNNNKPGVLYQVRNNLGKVTSNVMSGALKYTTNKAIDATTSLTSKHNNALPVIVLQMANQGLKKANNDNLGAEANLSRTPDNILKYTNKSELTGLITKHTYNDKNPSITSDAYLPGINDEDGRSIMTDHSKINFKRKGLSVEKMKNTGKNSQVDNDVNRYLEMTNLFDSRLKIISKGGMDTGSY
jgi:hypothetical protein